uniref:C2 domain-containing protein n=1 Tax=Timema monikensis TaxID=170555 RepID=A0A7R9E3E9_9NEOP|nr:unnamed protein product [Timema monikensis]
MLCNEESRRGGPNPISTYATWSYVEVWFGSATRATVVLMDSSGTGQCLRGKIQDNLPLNTLKLRCLTEQCLRGKIQDNLALNTLKLRCLTEQCLRGKIQNNLPLNRLKLRCLTERKMAPNLMKRDAPVEPTVETTVPPPPPPVDTKAQALIVTTQEIPIGKSVRGREHRRGIRLRSVVVSTWLLVYGSPGSIPGWNLGGLGKISHCLPEQCQAPGFLKGRPRTGGRINHTDVSTEPIEAAVTPTPGKSKANEISEQVVKLGNELAHDMGIPMWGLIAIIVGICLVFLCICVCCIRRCCKKRRSKDGKKGKGGVDLKSVQLLGSAYKEKVQPDMEELTENQEEADEAESKQSEIKLGRLQYKLEYDFNSNSLSVTVIQAEDLPALDMGGTSDPYVKVYLLPDKKKKFETKVHRKTLSPVFNETFTFKNVPYAEAMNKTLVFAIFDFDRFSKHDQIGEVKLPLCQVDLAQTIEDWKELQSVEGEGGQLKIFRITLYLNITFSSSLLQLSLYMFQHLQTRIFFFLTTARSKMIRVMTI